MIRGPLNYSLQLSITMHTNPSYYIPTFSRILE
jgi:hypothetical protein